MLTGTSRNAWVTSARGAHIPCLVIFPFPPVGASVSLQLWGTGLTGCAVDAAVPGLLQHCSSSAGSTQLPEIKGRTSQGAKPFSNAHWCSKPQRVCLAELPRDGISKVGWSRADRKRGCGFAGLSVLSLKGNTIFLSTFKSACSARSAHRALPNSAPACLK